MALFFVVMPLAMCSWHRTTRWPARAGGGRLPADRGLSRRAPRLRRRGARAVDNLAVAHQLLLGRSLVGHGAMALAASPIIALEVMALALDLTRLVAKLRARGRLQATSAVW